MRKQLLFFFLLLLPAIQSHAVLKEENLDKTVIMLHKDLVDFQNRLDAHMAVYEYQRKEYWEKLSDLDNESQNFALVLYTQREDLLFDIAQTCLKIDNIYKAFQSEEYPFKVWQENLDGELVRYQRIIATLKRISSEELSPQGMKDREGCIAICMSVEKRLNKYRRLIVGDNKHYSKIAVRMSDLNTYNKKRFDKIRDRIFLTGTESFFTTLKHIKDRGNEFGQITYEHFFTGQTASHEWVIRMLQLVASCLGMLLLAIFLAYMFMTRWCPKTLLTTEVKAKRNYWIAVISIFLEAIFVVFVIQALLTRHTFILATTIVVEYLIIMGIILLSLTIRLDSKNISKGLKLYLPLICLTAYLIFLRVYLVPNIFVSFTTPIVFIVMSFACLYTLLKYGRNASRVDSFYSWASFFVMVFLTILSWSGFKFMSLLLSMFWVIFVTTIQTVICLRHILGLSKNSMKQKIPFLKTMWFKSLMNRLVVPMLYITAFVVSCIWSAQIFSMHDWIIEQMEYYFINLPDVASVSVESIIYVVSLAFIINYTIFAIKEILQNFYDSKAEKSMIPICITITTLVMWGVYACAVVFILKINNQALVAAVGGVSMGVGFALKDTIDNLFCGLSLMMGRVRHGDMIECDGIRGRIADIGIRSTMIETIDGSIIAFLNNQLFTKNFKNLTKNHNYEMNSIIVGIAYGSDVEKAKAIIIEKTKGLPFISPNKKVNVTLDNFNDSSLDLKVFVWVPVADRISSLSAIREIIYNAFNEAGIEIPFPQQDVYVKEQPSA